MKTYINKSIALIMVAMFSVTVVFNSCKSEKKTAKAAAIGAAAGGIAGAVIGGKGNTAEGAIIGAVIGGAAGAAIGRYMDKQAEELQRDLENARVERVGEGIKITFNSGILFDQNAYDLKPAAKSNLNDLARVLKKYEDTNVLVEGHTDDTGTDEKNKVLSERRAESVKHYLATLGVPSARISSIGYGETAPVADNTSESGRESNRRVEVAIMANKKLQKAAEKGEI